VDAHAHNRRIPGHAKRARILCVAPNGKSTACCVLLAALGLQLTARAGPGTAPQEYFAQTPVTNIDTVALIGPRAVSPGVLHLIQWAKSTNDSADIAVSWNVGALTGFSPLGAPDKTQLGVANVVGASAMQAEGNQIGFLIDSASLGHAANAHLAMVAHYDFVTPFKPFSAGKLLVYSLDAQIPSALGSGRCGTPGSACAYATMYFDLKDSSSGLRFWYGAEIFDSRGTPNGVGHLGETLMFDGATHQAIVGGVINLSADEGARFTTALPSSDGFQAKPWKGYKPFVFAISPVNLQNAIASVRARFAQYAALSGDPADYEVVHFNFNPEVAFFGGEGRIGVACENIHVEVQ
jgi:hypothetical protein